MWYRVFASIPDEPNPVRMVEHLHALGHSFTPHFTGDDLGWTTARLEFSESSAVTIGRYLTKADDLRHELNAYAAELETMDTEPNHGMLMERVIQTQQMFTIDKPANSAEGLCEVLAKWLAVETEGIIQIDGRGWLNAAGELLLREF
jgi:hypothetical protein